MVLDHLGKIPFLLCAKSLFGIPHFPHATDEIITETKSSSTCWAGSAFHCCKGPNDSQASPWQIKKPFSSLLPSVCCAENYPQAAVMCEPLLKWDRQKKRKTHQGKEKNDLGTDKIKQNLKKSELNIQGNICNRSVQLQNSL